MLNFMSYLVRLRGGNVNIAHWKMLQDIVNFPMDEFNDLLSKRELTEEQLNLCRDIRRRGKNKVEM